MKLLGIILVLVILSMVAYLAFNLLFVAMALALLAVVAVFVDAYQCCKAKSE